MSSAPRRALLALSSIAVLAAGCGDNNNDPRSVLLRFTTASTYKCGAKSAGEAYDLATNSLNESRERFVHDTLLQQQQNGCTPKRVPHIEAIELSRTTAVAVYDVRVQDPSTDFKRGRARVIKTDHGWKVDTGRGT